MRISVCLIPLFAASAMIGPATAQAPTLQMLDQLERGEWEVRFRGREEPVKLCLRTGQEFIQLRHPGANCSRYVVEDGTGEITVQYTCRNKGYGRTNIRRETNRLVQITGQGSVGSSPFEFTAEARRTGSCR